jgi:hypothetical protein
MGKRGGTEGKGKTDVEKKRGERSELKEMERKKKKEKGL